MLWGHVAITTHPFPCAWWTSLWLEAEQRHRGANKTGAVVVWPKAIPGDEMLFQCPLCFKGRSTRLSRGEALNKLSEGEAGDIERESHYFLICMGSGRQQLPECLSTYVPISKKKPITLSCVTLPLKAHILLLYHTSQLNYCRLRVTPRSMWHQEAYDLQYMKCNCLLVHLYF